MISSKVKRNRVLILEYGPKSCKEKRSKSKNKEKSQIYSLKLPFIKSQKKLIKIKNSFSRAFFAKSLKYKTNLVYDKIPEI